MKLPDKLIHKVMGEVAGLDGHKSSPKGRIILIASLMGKYGSRFFIDELICPIYWHPRLGLDNFHEGHNIHKVPMYHIPKSRSSLESQKQ